MKNSSPSLHNPRLPLVGGLFCVLSGLSTMVVSLAAPWQVAAAASVLAGLLAYLVLHALHGPARSGPEAAVPMKAAEFPGAPADIPQDRIDALTGLANMNGLNAWFSERGPRLAADGKSIIVILTRLDSFEPLLKSRGQVVADAVLVEVASRVTVVAGSEGIAARTEGDEFAAVVSVVPARSEALASERAGHLLELISRPIEHSSGTIWIGGSVGAATGSPQDGPGTLQRARKALIQASSQGRGHFIVAPKEG